MICEKENEFLSSLKIRPLLPTEQVLTIIKAF